MEEGTYKASLTMIALQPQCVLRQRGVTQAPPCLRTWAWRATHARRGSLQRAWAQMRELELGGGVIVTTPETDVPRGIVHLLGGAFAGAAPSLVVRRERELSCTATKQCQHATGLVLLPKASSRLLAPP